MVKSFINPNPLGCVQNRIQMGGFGTVRINMNPDIQKARKTEWTCGSSGFTCGSSGLEYLGKSQSQNVKKKNAYYRVNVNKKVF